MTVTLTKAAESYVAEVMKQLSTSQADEVVNSLLLKQRADTAYELAHALPTDAELVQKLLAGVRAPHRPYQSGEFRQQAERLIAEQEGS